MLQQKSWRPALRPGPHWGSSQRSRKPPSWWEGGKPPLQDSKNLGVLAQPFGLRVSALWASPCPRNVDLDPTPLRPGGTLVPQSVEPRASVFESHLPRILRCGICIWKWKHDEWSANENFEHCSQCNNILSPSHNKMLNWHCKTLKRYIRLAGTLRWPAGTLTRPAGSPYLLVPAHFYHCLRLRAKQLMQPLQHSWPLWQHDDNNNNKKYFRLWPI